MSSDEDDAVRLVNKRKKFFSNNSSDDEHSNTNINSSLVNSNDNNSNDECVIHTRVHKSRIKNNDTNSDSDEDVQKKNVSKFNRKNKLREKFVKFKAEKRKSHSKDEVQKISKDELLLFKENVQEASPHITLSVCDPDESEKEEENSVIAIKKIIGSKSSLPVKSNRVRMSAKEAMANMQKIKSESNRMLREKEVSLPYHRPKALSLKDIMNRRRPAVSSDGKSLPIKMNDEQLKHYAMMLEERQKEMIELCKSDSDEEDSEEKVSTTEMKVDDPSNKEDIPNTEDIAEQNDVSFDQILNISYNIQSGIQEQSTVLSEEKETIEQNILDHSNEKEIDEVEHTSEMKEEHSEADNTNIKNNTYFRTQACDQIETNDLVQQNKNNENTLSNDESQSITFNYNSENIDLEKTCTEMNTDTKDKGKVKTDVTNIDAFSDSDLDFGDLDALIENAEIIKDDGKENSKINSKPKLTGVPGTIISLDDDDSMVKPTGIELLKERFTYFAKLQKQEDIEKDREKQYKPGTQHFKLRQQLEEEIAEQRSLEWAKRLEEEKLLKSEQNEILGEDSFEDIDKIEATLEGLEGKKAVEENNSDDDGDDEGDEDEDLIEDDIEMTDKPKKRNPMLDNEAEESENEKDSDGIVDEENTENDDEEDEDNESESDSEDEQTKPKKGRILKAFEDSDDENVTEVKTQDEIVNKAVQSGEKMSQDDELQLAQANKSLSYDIFPSQGSCEVVTISKNIEGNGSEELGTFSILNTNSIEDKPDGPIPVIFETQNDNTNLDDIVCSGSFSQSIIVPNQKSQLTPSEFGDDVMALCTGKFYDNQFVSQNDLAQTECLDTESLSTPKTLVPIANLNTESVPSTISNLDITKNTEHLNIEINSSEKENTQMDKEELNDTEEKNKKSEEKLLRSILDELDEPEFDKPKQYKFFTSNETGNKKLVIESDDEIDEEKKEKKKKKKRKQIRALQISDDEEDEEMQTDGEEYESDDGDVDEKVYEYDSEENEVEVERPKKRKMGEFFENEAELTSEDEWAGSGDEDEVGLDRMEREEGDDDVFHEGKLQNELGQIHMREVLDQDKREVRLIQELLFEDADLGDGHRQRKFRWRNIDGEEESGVAPDERDTQEEEFESEEIWRKQRHEREMFLKKMAESGEESPNTSINRTTLIKANLSSRTMSNLLAESKESPVEKEFIEKKPTKDIPSPKKPFAIFKQSYHGSFLTRGRGALARLAALATPFVVDDDTPKVLASARGNFVFAAQTQEEQKIKKRKAKTSESTPQLIKKMKTEEYKKTLFEQLRY